ncbi:MAG: hypothetical protein LBU23_10090, partial [Planctomycetota bacterium]|nr:hypothetical protein [Planctomycetota bacterium]
MNARTSAFALSSPEGAASRPRTRADSGFSALYRLCRASGGSAALIERAVRDIAFASGGAEVVSGGFAVSGGELARLSREVAEIWRSSGGSRAVFERTLKTRLARLDGGRRFLAALAALGVLQGSLAPWAMAYPGASAGDETILVGVSANLPAGHSSANYSGVSVSGKVLSDAGGDGPTMGVYEGGSASDTTVSAGGSQFVYSGGIASDTTDMSGAIQTEGGNAIATSVSVGGAQTVA